MLITGCSSGIGRATARAFLEEGWTVYATSRDPDDVADLAETGCETAALDVTSPEQVAQVVERVADEQGTIDCLINNGGYAQHGPVEDVPTRDVNRQFDVNLYGPHRLIRAVLPHMRRAEDGTIVNVSSVLGLVAYPGSGVYAASKFALEGLSDALRAEVEPFGVDVVVVEPGPVDTNFEERARHELRRLDRSAFYDSVYALYDEMHAVTGVGANDPEEVAAVVLNAASATTPAPRYTVGVVARAASLARFLPGRWRDVAYRFVSRLVR